MSSLVSYRFNLDSVVFDQMTLTLWYMFYLPSMTPLNFSFIETKSPYQFLQHRQLFSEKKVLEIDCSVMQDFISGATYM